MLKGADLLVIRAAIGTIAAMYCRPDCTPADVVYCAQQAINCIPETDKVIIAGDLNCPVDKMDRKTTLVVDYLHGEGLTLVNNRNESTHLP